MLSWGRNHRLFRSELIRGFSYQRLVADFLLCHDIPVMLPRMRIRAGGIENAHHYAQEPDVVAGGHVLEIKSRNLPWMDVSDLPPDVLIDTVDGYDAKLTKPLAYVIVSQSTGSMVWTHGDTPTAWTKRTVNDTKRGIRYEAYACSKRKFAPMSSLVQRLKELPHPKPERYEGRSNRSEAV